MKRLFCIIVGAALTLALAGSAQALTDDQVQQVLTKFGSPLPSWTIGAFSRAHPDFDVAGYLAVAWAESSLGKDCGIATNNPGCIKGGPVGSVWRDLRVGTRRGFNLYASLYDGQRALIRLLYDRGYNASLASHDWWGFSARYYGAGVSGRSAYTRNLRRAHELLERAFNETEEENVTLP